MLAPTGTGLRGYAVAPELNAWKNDPHLDPAIASIEEPLGNAVHSLLPEDNIEDLAGRSVLVTGCGPIASPRDPGRENVGGREVVATEVNRVRIDLAWKMGADLVLNPVEEADHLTTHKDVQQHLHLSNQRALHREYLF